MLLFLGGEKHRCTVRYRDEQYRTAHDIRTTNIGLHEGGRVRYYVRFGLNFSSISKHCNVHVCLSVSVFIFKFMQHEREYGYEHRHGYGHEHGHRHI